MSEIRGIWITNRPHSQVLASKRNIAEAMDFLESTGFNYIFPVVWNRGYTLFPSQVMAKYNFPAIEPYYAQQKLDTLAEITTQAHQRQIKVIPWLEYGFAASHLLSGGQILQQKPHWQAIDREGAKVRHGSLTWMNAFNCEVQQFMQELIIEIVSQYNVDGIQGCDRLPALPVTAGYDRETKALYQAEFGKQPPNNIKDKQWIQWRADILTEFLANTYKQVKQVNPKLIVSLSPAVYPFCLNNLLQDTPTWINQGLVDLIHPQIYRPSFFGYQREVKQITKTCNYADYPKFVPGIAFTANGKDISSKDLIKYIQLNRQSNFSGQVFFHYEGLRKNNDAMAIALVESADYNKLA